MGLTLGEANRILQGALAKAQELEHQDQRRGLRWRRPAGRISAHGQRDMGERLCEPRQGRRLGWVRPSKRRDGGARRPANAARGCRGGGWPHDHGPGSGSDHTQWRRRGGLRRQRRHCSAGRRLRPRWRRAVVVAAGAKDRLTKDEARRQVSRPRQQCWSTCPDLLRATTLTCLIPQCRSDGLRLASWLLL
jgi:hypothetical protein